MNRVYYTISVIIPLFMLIVGMVWRHRPPQKINAFYGYRTSMSMKNKDTWIFAHHYIANVWCYLGLILAGISVACSMAFQDTKDYDAIIGGLVIFQAVVICLSIIPTERALKKNFDQNGKRKE